MIAIEMEKRIENEIAGKMVDGLAKPYCENQGQALRARVRTLGALQLGLSICTRAPIQASLA